MIAPILLIVGAVLSATPCFVVVFALGVYHPALIALAVLIPLGVAGAGIFVLIERLKEIKGGEEDDLGNY